MLSPYDIDGFYDTSRRVERELTDDPESLVDLVARAPQLRALARDRSWIVLFTQPRLTAKGFADWVKDPSSAGGSSQVTVVRIAKGGGTSELGRTLPEGLRVANIQQRRWRSRGLELRLEVAAREAETWGVWRGQIQLRVGVDELTEGSVADLLYAGGVRTRQVRGIRQRERDAEARAQKERAEAAAVLEAQGHEARRNATAEHIRGVARARDVYADDDRLGELGSLGEVFDAAVGRLSLAADQVDRIRQAALVRIDLCPADPEHVATGRSSQCGDPQLPPEFPWPEGVRGPMWLWLQLDLDAIPRLPHSLLPTHGRLLVFVGTGKYEDAPEVRVVWIDQGPFETRAHPPGEWTLEESMMSPLPPTPLHAGLAIDLPCDLLHRNVTPALLQQPDEEPVRKLSEAFGLPEKISLMGHGEDHGAAEEDPREPKEPAAWIALVTTTDDGPWDPMAASVLIHRDDLRSLDFSRVRLLLYNVS